MVQALGRHPLRFFHPVIRARDVGASPVRVTVAGEAFALFRDHRGRIGALRDRCPHRFAPLSRGRVRPDGRLACPYHGWHFDVRGRGRSPTQPTLSRCDVEAMQVIEQQGYVWIGNAQASADALPERGWPGFHYAGGFSVPFAAPLHVVLDNFSEDEHTPWVHTRLGWNERDVETVEYAAENFDDRTEVHYVARQRPKLAAHLLGLPRNARFQNDWITSFDPVRTLYTISFLHPDRDELVGVTLRAMIFMVPEEERTTQMHVLVWLRYHDRRLAAMRRLADPLALALARREIEDDARFIPTVADVTPDTMRGMRLGKYDKPLIHNRKLLRRIYWGLTSTPANHDEDLGVG